MKTFADRSHDVLVKLNNKAFRSLEKENIDGGPFAAEMALYNDVTGDFVPVGKMGVNRVLKKGPTAHAEAEAMNPKNIETLVGKLQSLRDTIDEWRLVFYSSAQSCPSCQSRLEILALYLVQKNLIPRDNVYVVYGATFADTAAKAYFNDIYYAHDLVLAGRSVFSKETMVTHRVADLCTIPKEIASIVRRADEPIAIITRNNEILSQGIDTRDATLRDGGALRDQMVKFDLFSTPEVSAIRNACEAQQKEEKPWMLDNGKGIVRMYTIAPDTEDIPNVGALSRSEAQWTGVREIISIKDFRHSSLATREAPRLSNREFLHNVSLGYNHDRSILKVYRDQHAPTTALDKWGERVLEEGDRILYNGIEPAYEGICVPLTHYYFMGEDLGYEGIDSIVAPVTKDRAKAEVNSLMPGVVGTTARILNPHGLMGMPSRPKLLCAVNKKEEKNDL